ncbi:MAG TPA: crosslink repair DNA glycosylase YcaQ family protein, partial [Polyangia bacterium]|nr:crosslink repair DNA glycosylase YcaQ family protein [Polyangia bacterium]
EDTPAPVRFLPEYDNVFLSHVDRARIVSAADLPRLKAGNGFLAPFLVDGFVRGTWRITRAKDAATLTLTPVRKLAAAERADVETEGARLLAFMEPDARRRDVRVAPG